jgi:hypothetical protein
LYQVDTGLLRHINRKTNFILSKTQSKINLRKQIVPMERKNNFTILFIMKFVDIEAFDVTGGWNLDRYSLQSGHKVRLRPANVAKHAVKWVKWRLDTNGHKYGHTVTHVFKNNNLPAEGYAVIHVDLLLKNGQRLRGSRRILVVPRVECQIMCEQYEIGNDTEWIDIVAQPLCAQITMGNALNGDSNYACGGSCFENCPKYEIRVSEPNGTRIYEYGYHRIWCTQEIYGSDNENCLEVYRDNIFYRNGVYPPLEKIVKIEPIGLSIIRDGDKFTLDGLSEKMLPYHGKVVWRFYRNDKLHHCVTSAGKTTVSHLSSGQWRVKATVVIPQGRYEPIKVTASIIN